MAEYFFPEQTRGVLSNRGGQYSLLIGTGHQCKLQTVKTGQSSDRTGQKASTTHDIFSSTVADRLSLAISLRSKRPKPRTIDNLGILSSMWRTGTMLRCSPSLADRRADGRGRRAYSRGGLRGGGHMRRRSAL